MLFDKIFDNKKKEKKQEKIAEIKKTINENDISQAIEKNYEILDNILDLNAEPLENLKVTLEESKNKELFKKIDSFTEIIDDIKNYKESTLNNLLLDIKTAKEILSDSGIEGGCILDLIKKENLSNTIKKDINKILYYNLKDVEDLVFVVDDATIEKNADILGIKENEFKDKMQDDPDYIINELLNKLVGNNNIDLSNIVDNSKHINSRLSKVIILSVLLTIGVVGPISAQENKAEVSFNKSSSINLDDIFSSQASQEDIKKVEDAFNGVFKDKKIAENLNKDNIIKNIGWIKAITKIEDSNLRQNIIDGLDKEKQLGYKEFLLFINARQYLSENNEGVKSKLLQYMQVLLVDIDKIKSSVDKTSEANIDNPQIKEGKENIVSIKKLITDKIYSMYPSGGNNEYSDEETIRYISSAGLKSDRDYVNELYKQLKQEEAKLAQMQK